MQISQFVGAFLAQEMKLKQQQKLKSLYYHKRRRCNWRRRRYDTVVEFGFQFNLANVCCFIFGVRKPNPCVGRSEAEAIRRGGTVEASSGDISWMLRLLLWHFSAASFEWGRFVVDSCWVLVWCELCSRLIVVLKVHFSAGQRDKVEFII